MSSVMTIPRESVTKIQQSYCCSSCWNYVVLRVEKGLDDDEYIVDCGTEGCNTPGLVSAKYIQRRLAENEAEAQEAKTVLKDAIQWMTPRSQRLSVGTLLSDLGY